MKRVLLFFFLSLVFFSCILPAYRPQNQKEIYAIEPLNQSIGVSTATVLNWNLQLESSEKILYDLYLTVNPESLNNDTSLVPFASSLEQHFFYPDHSFAPNTTYYWRVMAHIPNSSGNEAVFSRLFSFTTGTTGKSSPRYFLLSVGVNDYQEGAFFKNLSLPDDDAKDAVRLFSKLNEPWQIDSLIGMVEADSLFDKLNQIAQRAKPDDLFVLHYAGHGVYLPQFETSLLVLSKVEQTSDSQVLHQSAQTVSVQELKAQLDPIKGKKWLFVDCCQSGAFIHLEGRGILSENQNRSSQDDSQRAFSKAFIAPFEEDSSSLSLYCNSNLSNSPLYHIMTATKIDEDSYESSILQNGIFSFSLFDALGAPSDPKASFDFSFDADVMPYNYQIHFNELRMFVQKRVNILLKETNLTNKKMTVMFYPLRSEQILTAYFPVGIH